MTETLLTGLLAAAAVVIFTAVFLLTRRYILSFKRMKSIKRLTNAIDESTAAGKRVHIGLANSQFLSPLNASSLVGLEVLRQVEQNCLASDSPAVASGSDAATVILARDVVNTINRVRGQETLFDPGLARQTGFNPLTYALGTAAANRGDEVQAQLVMGDFGSEVLFVQDAVSMTGGYSLLVSNTVSGQAAAYVASDEPLIGEELFALPALLSENNIHKASLTAQDVLRWLIIILILAGVLFKIIARLLVVPV